MTWYTVTGVFWGACGFALIGFLVWQLTRPFTETDEWCSRMDEQLDAERDERVLHLRRLRVVDALDETGDLAGATVFEFPKVPSTARDRGVTPSSSRSRVDGRTAGGGASSEPASLSRRSLPQRHFGGWSA